MIRFETIARDRFEQAAPEMFAIMSANMADLVRPEKDPLGGLPLWREETMKLMQSRHRKMILIYSDETIIGFFICTVQDGCLSIEDMQIAAEWQGKNNIFWMLFNYLSPKLPDTLTTIRAKTKKKNAKAHGILLHLGLHVVDETENSYLYEGEYKDFLNWFNRK